MAPVARSPARPFLEHSGATQSCGLPCRKGAWEVCTIHKMGRAQQAHVYNQRSPAPPQAPTTSTPGAKRSTHAPVLVYSYSPSGPGVPSGPCRGSH